ncbi:restriction endonuclease subunit S [Candidatus Poribacteria bacterium]|nr:restriction endonuclease subunit S [Candidatus Poribacteria bacterium]
MRIGDLFEAKAGGDYDPSNCSDVRDNRYPYPIYANGLTQQGLYGFSNYAEELSGSITVTGRGTLGQAFYRDTPFVAIGRLIVLKPKTSIDARFFCEYINYGIEFAVESTGVPQLTAPQISNYLIPVPPKPEQHAIAEVLSDVDGLLNALDTLIAKKLAIKQATMQQLLTDKTRLPGFSGVWETKRLVDVSDIDPENFSSNTIPDYQFNYISLEQVDSGKLLGYSEEIFRTAPSRARRILRNGDVLMSTVRSNLMAHLFFQEQIPNAVCSTGFAVLRAKHNLSDPYFLFSQLFSKSVNDQITKILAGSNYPAINSRDVKLIEIPCPPQVSEQRAITSILSDMDAEIAALEQRRDKTRAIKQGMMQQLLTGKGRLLKSE